MAEFQIVDGVLKKYNGSEATVVIPDTVSVIGESAFEGCETVSCVTIPETVTEIDSYAFADCERLEKINLPHSLTQISFALFQRCHNLPPLPIPTGVTEIDGSAFEGCPFTSLVIPAAVKKYPAPPSAIARCSQR